MGYFQYSYAGVWACHLFIYNYKNSIFKMEHFQYSYAGIWACECFNSSVTDDLATEAQRINRVYQKIFQIFLNAVTLIT